MSTPPSARRCPRKQAAGSTLVWCCQPFISTSPSAEPTINWGLSLTRSELTGWRLAPPLETVCTASA
eukprot:6088997-Prorocentrum_lima.AAC.1